MKRFGALLAAAVLGPLTATAPAADFSRLYPEGELARDRARYEERVIEIYRRGIEPHLSAPERRSLAAVRFEFPLPRPGDHPLSFFSYARAGRPYVALPALSLKLVEDLSTAYAWLWASGYSFDTVDLYAAMLRHKAPAEFPGGRYPPPLVALGVPASALSDPRVDGMSLRMRNSAWAFILLHELAHVLYRHPGYSGISPERARANERQADGFALAVLERTGTIPMGAILFFQAQAYSLPNRGQFDSEEAWERFLRTEASHPLTADRLSALARGLDAAASRESRPAERDTLRYIATRLLDIAGVLEDAVLQRCIAVVADRAPASSLAPRRGVAGDQLERWCGKKD